MKVNPIRSANTSKVYRQNLGVNLPDWVNRPLNAITRRDVEARFLRITEKHGWAGANQTMKMLRSLYRRSCVDYEGLKNPVEFCLPAGGKYHPHRRRRISSPAEVLPQWCAVNNDMKQAKQTALDALPVRSQNPDVHAGFGDLFLRLNMCAEAQTAYIRALALDSRHVYSLVGLGTISRRNNRFTETVEHYRTALFVNPNEPYARDGLSESLVRARPGLHIFSQNCR